MINQAAAAVSHVYELPSSVQPTVHTDLRVLWNQLTPSEKLGALVSSFAVVLLTAATTIPIYYLGKLLYSSVVGLKAALIYSVVPSIVMFLPHVDVVTPLLTASSLYFFMRAIKRHSFLAAFLSGVLLFLGAFLTLTVLAIGLIYGLLAVAGFLRDVEIRRRAHWYACAFTAGFIVLPVVLFFATGLDPLALVYSILTNHAGFVVARSGQPLWLLYNYYDFFLFLGIPLLVLAVGQLLRMAKRPSLLRLEVLLLGFWVLTLILDISGSMHGETGRTWIPFIPFILLPLVNYIDQIDYRGHVFLTVLTLQGLQVLTLATFLRTL